VVVVCCEFEVVMNLVLFKFGSDLCSYVVVMGWLFGDLMVGEFVLGCGELVWVVWDVFDDFCVCVDLVVVEGVGSFVEVNLCLGDFVNMGLV